MSDQWEELADEEYHRRPDTTPKPEPQCLPGCHNIGTFNQFLWVHQHGCQNAPKPEPPKLPRRHSWAAASNGVIACKVCGTPIRDNWMTDCPGEPEPPKPCPCGDQGRPGHPSGWCREPEPPPDVAKKHHWTTVDVNPDGPIVCRYCEVEHTRENENEICEGKPPDVASEPDKDLIDDTVIGIGLMFGAEPLNRCHCGNPNRIGAIHTKIRCMEGVPVASGKQVTKGGVEYTKASNTAVAIARGWAEANAHHAHGPLGHLSRAYLATSAENAALKAEEVKRREICLALQAQSQENRAEAVRMEAERDEARAEAERREMENSRLVIELAKLREERSALIDRFRGLLQRKEKQAAKLREERDAAEAVILEEYESWGSDCSDDFVVMAKEIQRRREEKGGE